jgi:hypothetical protein
MEVEYVSRIGFSSRWAAEEEAKLTVRGGLFRQVVINA